MWVVVEPRSQIKHRTVEVTDIAIEKFCKLSDRTRLV
jgi:hypothetical protein